MRHSFASGVTYRLTYRVHILIGIDAIAQRYLVNCCSPIANVTSGRSANLHRFIVPRYRRRTHGRWAFSVGVRPSGIHCLSNGVFRRTLKTILFASYWCTERNWDALREIALYKFIWHWHWQ